jgi:hypothetical protein
MTGKPKPASQRLKVERVQTGIRVEKRILKVLKAVAEYKDMTLGDLIEGIVLHAFEGRAPFDGDTIAHIEDFKRIYGLDLDASASHRMEDNGNA